MSLLRDIDFTQGIRSENIDYNFSILNTEMKRERLRASGWGLVEGFAVAVDGMKVQATSGTIINRLGEEKYISSISLTLDEPDTIQLTELCRVDMDGKLTLKEKAYSATNKGLIESKTDYVSGELVICDANNAATLIAPVRVFHESIDLNATVWAGRMVKVTYSYALNRMDSIFVSTDGVYKVEKGVMSDSPSHVDLDEYEWFCVCIAEVVIAADNYLTLSTKHREYRSVYVDKDNKLFLNGELYEHSQVIHFTEPVPAYDKALWYDSESNLIYVWTQVNGKYQWLPVNKPIIALSCDVKIWAPEENPLDLQTFVFADTETNLQFIPEGNQLNIIIDNAPLMSDQYTEVTEATSGGEEVGIGFKLAAPLDRATHVECRVTHNTQEAPLRTVFKRYASFADSNYVVLDSNMVAQDSIIEIDEYKAGNDALEIYLNGSRLVKGIDYSEQVVDGEVTRDALLADKGTASTKIKLLNAATVGQILSWKVVTVVASYADIDEYIGNVESGLQGQIDAAEIQITDLQQDMTIVKDNTIPALQAGLSGLASDVADKLDSAAVLGWNNMPANFSNQLFNSRVDITLPAVAINTLTGIGANRYLQVFLFDTATTSRILIHGLDYQISAGADPTLALKSELVSGAKTLYVTGFELGLA